MVRLFRGKRLSIVLVACLVCLLAVGPVAGAATRKVRPSAIFARDAYESDNDSSTAKVVPETSIHTFDTSETTGYTDDQDWIKFSVDTAGQPVIVDGQFMDSQNNWDPNTVIWKLEDDGSLTYVDSQDDWYNGPGWRASMFGRLYLTGLTPGTYFAQIYQDDEPYSPGRYKLFNVKGDARRVAGNDRFQTAVEVSKELYPDADNIRDGDRTGPRNIFVASAANFADALSAVPLAVQEQIAMEGDYGFHGAVVLLTQPGSLPEVTRAEIERLSWQNYTDGSAYYDPSYNVHVYVLGGPAAVSDTVLTEIKGIRGVSFVQRVGGPNRFATAAAIADLTGDQGGNPQPSYVDLSSTVYLVNGYSFPDALSAGPVAGFDEAPILLTRKSACPSETIDWLKANDVSQVVAVGSTMVIDDAVLEQIESEIPSIETTRVGGANRYETSYDLANWGLDRGMEGKSSVVVSGQDFPDGLAGGVICGNDRGPLLLTPPTSLSPYVTQFHVDNGGFTHSGMLVGGPMAVSDGVYSAYKDLWKLIPVEK